MRALVEEFMANLLLAGFNREQVAEAAYTFALTLQEEEQQKGDNHVSSAYKMARAAELVKSALPEAYRIYALHFRMY